MLISEIAEHIGGTVLGDASLEITQICKIDQAVESGITFLANEKYSHFLNDTKASAIITTKSDYTSSKTLIQVDDPYLAFTKVISLFYIYPVPFELGIHPTAIIEKSAKIGKNCRIAPHVYIGKNTVIGDNALIYPNVTIMDDCKIGNDIRIFSNVSIREECEIGNNVIIHNNAVIGSDGFGFAPNPPHGFDKIYQIGNVVVEDDVEIGANCTLDRSTMGSTLVKKGTKLDNMIHVGHNVVIGQHNVFAAQTGIAGSVQIGDWNQFGGQIAINGHIKIGNQTRSGMKTLITKDTPDGTVLMGSPGRPESEFKRAFASSRKLPDLIKDVRNLKKEIEELKKR